MADAKKDDQIDYLEKLYLRRVFECQSQEAVEAAITYARYLTKLGVTPETLPIFLRVLEIRNRWVIEALVGSEDPFQMLSKVQPNRLLMEHIFKILDHWQRNVIYSTNLALVLGALRAVYASPKDGFELYPLDVPQVNALGKHLHKESGQDDPVNRTILHCLDKLSQLSGPEGSAIERVGTHAAAIRNAFFDQRLTMADVIPKTLLEAETEMAEIEPRGQGEPGQKRTGGRKAAAKGR